MSKKDDGSLLFEQGENFSLRSKDNYLLVIYTIFVCLLFLYSFTQIDLGLALTRFPFLYTIQRGFQYIGYFNRPLSTWLYGGLLVGMFVTYGFILHKIHKQKIKPRALWVFIFIISVILTLSYNAFSYDLFNYIFDAKIFTLYGKNPYAFKALDFPGDPMLGFMHWTHRTYPYGPAWLGLTIPLSYIGMHMFLPTFYLFKILAGVAFIGTVYYLQKITAKLFPGHEAFVMAFFAFNPFVLIESLVSAHIDATMMFFAVASLFYLIEKKYWFALGLFVLSVAVKFATIFLFPVFLAIVTMQVMKEKIPWVAFLLSICVCMLLAVAAAATQSGNFQPWYLLGVIPFAALVSNKYYVLIPSFVISVAATIIYMPFLYFGNWDDPVKGILGNIYIGASLLAIGLPILYWFLKRSKLL